MNIWQGQHPFLEFSFYNSIPRPSSVMKLVIQSEKVKSNLEVNRFDFFCLMKNYTDWERLSLIERGRNVLSASVCVMK